ncbi:DUF397 domain-containing protein [Peterkaempfera griseoplana]|uniref:DUF397 domain-containing protein n=1 Tax=Peterkaempfera griseoplana TaxID=66896 RepID=UPI0006E13ABB|nr:DUF397 domain-containing protein [Peterkaempfera griseoplana]
MNTDGSAAGATGAAWFRSSHSDGEGGQCVEVSVGAGAVRVRDSKDREGPLLSFTAEAWTAFVDFAAGR